MQLKIKGDGSLEIDVRMSNRSDVAHVALRAIPTRAFHGPLVLMRVPGDDNVCEQCQRA